jgi:thymidylate synthase
MFILADTLDDLLRRVLNQIAESGVSIEASRGSNRELAGVLLKLTNPRARLSHTETKGKVFSPLGELAWYLSASDNADFITYYLQRYRDETESDGTIHGAYGPRMFTAEWHNQFENVVELLRRKPNSRQAVIQLFDSGDLAGTYKDIPCTCTFQFMIRNERLDMITSMRSNDVFKGLPHDIFSFTMIQEIMARMLRIELGEYFHFAGSLHLYDDQADAARNFLDEGVQGTVGAAMPPMPPGDPWPAIRAFLLAEAAIRIGLPADEQINSLDLYWQDLVRLLWVFRHWKNDASIAISRIKNEMTDRFYSEYIAMKEQPK